MKMNKKPTKCNDAILKSILNFLNVRLLSLKNISGKLKRMLNIVHPLYHK